VVLEACEAPGAEDWSAVLKADGSGASLISREGGTRLPAGRAAGPYPLAMKGHPVFNFAVKVLDEVLRDLLARSGFTFADLSCVIPHQANARIVEAVARRMGLPLELFLMNVETTGNTSAASIPVALDVAVRSGRVKDDDLVALVGFGAGLTYGGVLMRWKRKAVTPKEP
jgi:3-oxoacyl-[acyl-carrier-protein] synthase-3